MTVITKSVITKPVFAKYSAFCWLNLLMLSLLGACTPLAETEAPTAQEPAVSLPSSSFEKKSMTIGDLRQDPKPNQTVELEGVVRQRVPLLEGWIYELEDETGRIWILTDASEPVLDTPVYVEGTVQYEQILIGDVDIGDYYIAEDMAEEIAEGN
ncbi:MAG: hypothetical protein AAF152_16045 [Cyanobacteria bacterium P01_A01_bin.114]